jgi:hypothetical protein
MNGHPVESGSHLTKSGVETAKAVAQDPVFKELNASSLTITKTTAPREPPEINSKEVWAMKTCTDHSELEEDWFSSFISRVGFISPATLKWCPDTHSETSLDSDNRF